jgi:hypothetical protein
LCARNKEDGQRGGMIATVRIHNWLRRRVVWLWEVICSGNGRRVDREHYPTMSNRARAFPGFVMAWKSRQSVDVATAQFCFRWRSLDVMAAKLREFAG